jgi:hypothetical protein
LIYFDMAKSSPGQRRVRRFNSPSKFGITLFLSGDLRIRLMLVLGTPPLPDRCSGGKLRVGMIAITVLGGVAEPVARFFGQKLGAAFEPMMYPNPDSYLQSFGKGEWNIAIGPRVRAPADMQRLNQMPFRAEWIALRLGSLRDDGRI